MEDEELAEIDRIDIRREKVWTIAIIAIVMSIAIGLVAWTLFSVPTTP